MVGSLALVERLLAKLAAAGGEAAQQRIDAFERRLDASSAYFGGPSPGAPGRQENMTGFRVAGRA